MIWRIRSILVLCIDCNLRDKEFMEVFIKDLKVEKVFCAVFIVKFPLLNPGSHLISTIELFVAYQICTFCCLLCYLTPEAQCGGRGFGCVRNSHPGPSSSAWHSVFLTIERLRFCRVGLRSESWEGLKIRVGTWNLTWLMSICERQPKYSL